MAEYLLTAIITSYTIYLLYIHDFLDIFHAKTRVLKTLPKYHADYCAASKLLTQIFSQLTASNSNCSKSEFIRCLDEWVKMFSIAQHGKTSHDMIEAIGNLLQEKPVTEQSGTIF